MDSIRHEVALYSTPDTRIPECHGGAIADPASSSPCPRTIGGWRLVRAALRANRGKCITGHAPSRPLRRALLELAAAMAAMTECWSENCLYLCSIDPGGGKTRTIVSFCMALLAYTGWHRKSM